MAARMRSGSTNPSHRRRHGRRRTLCSRKAAELSTAGCSMQLRTRWPPRRCCAHAAPWTARLADSVPSEVKMISSGEAAWMRLAAWARAASSASRARKPCGAARTDCRRLRRRTVASPPALRQDRRGGLMVEIDVPHGAGEKSVAAAPGLCQFDFFLLLDQIGQGGAGQRALEAVLGPFEEAAQGATADVIAVGRAISQR